ncbi:MAG TPA: hypothetical protein PLX89_22685 [Verrucomicrobiota bacterium]|nr:hypothetical protein [Verrucomicrobiota bacterium]
MTKQSWTLVALAVLLGALYLFRFTDLGRARQIQINVSSRPFAPLAAADDPLPVIFGLDREWQLTGLRVTPLAEVTNAHPKCAWNLESKNGSTPTRGFAYGDDVPGMKPVGGTAAVKLIPGTAYRLEIEAGRARGAANFTPQAAGGVQ